MNEAFFPLLRGVDLGRAQERLLAALLRQPGLVPTVLRSGITSSHFSDKLRGAFELATKTPGRAREIVANPEGGGVIKRLYWQTVELTHGQTLQLAKQIVFSIRASTETGRSLASAPAFDRDVWRDDESAEAFVARRLRARPTPQMTVEAVLYCVRDRGLAALREPANVRRLTAFDRTARAELNARIAKYEAGGQIPKKD